MVSHTGIEPVTPWLKVMCSTNWANGSYGAGDEGRTRDIQLGRLTLYQLSYSRIYDFTNILTMCLLVAEAGFEPTTFGLWARRATRLLHPASTDLLHTPTYVLDYKLVRKGGLEPPRPKALPPQGSVSTNSTTTAAVTHSSSIVTKKKGLIPIIRLF